MVYTEDELLMLSGIQHYRFCPRQWALIHMEQLWDENRLTVEGNLLHKNVDNPFYRQKNGDTITMRSVPIVSYKLGLYGLSDAIELQSAESEVNSIHHPKYPGNWNLYPIEYKRGKPKKNEEDEVQLVAQAMCLEEMYNIRIEEGSLFYGETHHRTIVPISGELRKIVKECSDEMHEIYRSHITPKADRRRHCRNCSLLNLCIPELSEMLKVSNYLKINLYENIT